MEKWSNEKYEGDDKKKANIILGVIKASRELFGRGNQNPFSPKKIAYWDKDSSLSSLIRDGRPSIDRIEEAYLKVLEINKPRQRENEKHIIYRSSIMPNWAF